MLPKLLIAAGAALVGYKAWYDRLPLAKRLKVGDQASVPAADVIRTVVPGSVQAWPVDAVAIVDILALKPITFVGKVGAILAADGKQMTFPSAESAYASVELPRDIVRSVQRTGSDGITRTVS